VAQAVECLLCKHKALSSNSNPTERERDRKEGRKEGGREGGREVGRQKYFFMFAGYQTYKASSLPLSYIPCP
jgi:hypothetical protein